MQFSYTISEDDFLKGVRLRCQTQARRGKLILFVVSLIIIAIIVGSAISRGTQPQTTEESPRSSSSGTSWVPISIIVVGFAVVLQFSYYGPRRLRQLYRKNPAMQGRFTVEITPELIAMDSTAEFTSRSKWNLYEFWREKDHLIVLVLLSDVFIILNIADLTEPQLAELRGILSSALPSK